MLKLALVSPVCLLRDTQSTPEKKPYCITDTQVSDSVNLVINKSKLVIEF